MLIFVSRIHLGEPNHDNFAIDVDFFSCKTERYISGISSAHPVIYGGLYGLKYQAIMSALQPLFQLAVWGASPSASVVSVPSAIK